MFDLESQQPVRLRINGDGFRGPDIPIAKSEDTLRVAVIGDSFVSAVSVAEQETFTHLLGEALKPVADRPKVETMNFGVSGADLADYLQFYRHFVSKYRPDVVVCCFFHGNDLADRFPELADSSQPHPFSQYCVPKFRGLKRLLGRHSRFYMWYEIKIRNLRDQLRAWSKQTLPGIYYYCMGNRFERRLDDYMIYISERNEKIDRRWEVVEQQLACLQREVSQAGAKLLLVGIPRAEQVDREMWQMLCREGNKTEGQGWSRIYPDQRLSEICTRIGVAYLPLLGDFQAEGRGVDLYFGREHFNPEGHRVVADLIAKGLCSRGIVSPAQIADQSELKPR